MPWTFTGATSPIRGCTSSATGNSGRGNASTRRGSSSARTGGSIKEASELLGLTYKTLQYRLKKHEIDRKGEEADELDQTDKASDTTP